MVDTVRTLKRTKTRLRVDSLKGLIVKCLESEGSLSLQALQKRIGKIEGEPPLAQSLDGTLRRLRRENLVETKLIQKEVLDTPVEIRVFELTPAGQEALEEAEARMNKWAMA